MPPVGCACVLTLPGYQKCVEMIWLWAKAMKWARYAGSLKLAGDLTVLKKYMDMPWMPWKHSKDNSAFALHVLQEEAVTHADQFEVCYFLSPTFCCFCARLISMEKYFARLVFNLLYKSPSTMLKMTFQLLLHLFFSIPQMLFYLPESEAKQHWVNSLPN